MIGKEELKAMYFYVGPYYYNHKLIRMFREKVNGAYVFYYDNNGELSLMGVRDTNILAKELIDQQKSILYDISNYKHLSEEERIARGFTNVADKHQESAINRANASSLEDNNQLVGTGKRYAIKNDSIVAYALPSNDTNILNFEIVDTSAEKPFVCRISFNTQGKYRGSFDENDIYTVIEMLEEYKEYEEDANLVLKNLNTFEIILQDSDVYDNQHKSVSSGVCYEDKAYINVTKGDYNFKSTLRHELFHAFTRNYNNRSIVGLNKGSDFRSLTEIMTEFLTGKVNGKYTGYSKFMNYFELLCDGNVPLKAIQANFNNDSDTYIRVMSESLGCSAGKLRNLALIMDQFIYIDVDDNPNLSTNEKNRLKEEYDQLTKTIILDIKIEQMLSKGEEVTYEKVESLMLKLNIKHPLLLADKENLNADILKARIALIDEILKLKITTPEGDYTNRYKFIDIINNKLLPKGKRIENFSELIKVIAEYEGKIDTDLAHFYALTVHVDELLKNLNILCEKFSDRALATVQQSLLMQSYENKEEKLISLYNVNKEFYKGLIKNILIYGSDTYLEGFKGNGYLLMHKLYSQLSSEEKEEILLDILSARNKNSNTPLFNYGILNIISIDLYRNKYLKGGEKYNFIPNKQVANLMLNELITNNTPGKVCELINCLQNLFNECYDKKELCQMICKKILGETYNEHLNEFSKCFNSEYPKKGIETAYELARKYYKQSANNENKKIDSKPYDK